MCFRSRRRHPTEWGDEIDSIKSYDAQSQRSIENVDAVSFYPATELIFSSGDIFSALKKIKADTDKQALLFEKEKKLTEAARIRNKYAELEESCRLYGVFCGVFFAVGHDLCA